MFLELSVATSITCFIAVLMFLISRHHKYRRIKCYWEQQNASCDKFIGAPVFSATIGNFKNQKPVHVLQKDLPVWCITPYGLLAGHVTYIDRSGCLAVITSGQYSIAARFVIDFFSLEMSTRLGIYRAVWVISDIQRDDWDNSYTQGFGNKYQPYISRRHTAEWLIDETVLGNHLDIMAGELWFEFMFTGFRQPVEYYQSIEPIFDGSEMISWRRKREPETNRKMQNLGIGPIVTIK